MRWAGVLKKSQWQLYIHSSVQTNLGYRFDIWNEQNKIYINHFKHDHNSFMSKNNTKTSFSKWKVLSFCQGDYKVLLVIVIFQMNQKKIGQQCCSPLKTVLRRHRQEDPCKFKASLVLQSLPTMKSQGYSEKKSVS